MTKNLILLILLVFVSCGKKSDKGGGIISSPPTAGFDAQALATEFIKYQETFEDKMSELNVSDYYLGINLELIAAEDIPQADVLGKCTKYYSGGILVNRKITIDAPLWKKLSKASREELIYHELGHCVLGREHDLMDIGGRPLSIMYPYHLGTATYTAYYGSYMAELFKDVNGVEATAANNYGFTDVPYASTLASTLYFEAQFSSDHSHCEHNRVDLD